jgi:F-type H+-transporting ATPase subunit b
MSSLLSVLLSEGSIIDLDGTILVQLGIFLVLFFLLRALVFKPMTALFAAREEAIDGARDEARRMEREAKEQSGGFDEAIRRVRTEAGEQRDKLRADGLQLERTMLNAVKDETNRALEDARVKLDAERDAARRAMTAQTPVLARAIASKLLGREVQ